MMNKLMSIKEASAELGVSQGTLRRWEREGKIQPERTQSGTRRYSMAISYMVVKVIKTKNY